MAGEAYEAVAATHAPPFRLGDTSIPGDRTHPEGVLGDAPADVVDALVFMALMLVVQRLTGWAEAVPALCRSSEADQPLRDYANRGRIRSSSRTEPPRQAGQRVPQCLRRERCSRSASMCASLADVSDAAHHTEHDVSERSASATQSELVGRLQPPPDPKAFAMKSERPPVLDE